MKYNDNGEWKDVQVKVANAIQNEYGESNNDGYSQNYLNDKVVNVGTEVDSKSRVNVLYSHNLFDKDNATVGDGYIREDDVFVSSSSNKCILSYTEVKPNTQYTLTCNGIYRILFYNSSKTKIDATSNISSPYTFTTSANTTYIRMSGDTNINKDTIMLNEGSTALPYEPYATPSIYVDNEMLVSKNVYSLSEVVIGTWLGKPLYRKVVQITMPSDANYVERDLAISNVDNIMLNDKSFITNSTYRTPLNSSNANGAYTCWASALTTGKIAISNTGTAVRDKSATIIVEYTKTTDTVSTRNLQTISIPENDSEGEIVRGQEE